MDLGLLMLGENQVIRTAARRPSSWRVFQGAAHGSPCASSTIPGGPSADVPVRYAERWERRPASGRRVPPGVPCHALRKLPRPEASRLGCRTPATFARRTTMTSPIFPPQSPAWTRVERRDLRSQTPIGGCATKCRYPAARQNCVHEYSRDPARPVLSPTFWTFAGPVPSRLFAVQLSQVAEVVERLGDIRNLDASLAAVPITLYQ